MKELRVSPNGSRDNEGVDQNTVYCIVMLKIDLNYSNEK